MIDVHEVKCNTPCNYGLKYPCLLNNIWDRFNKTSPNYLPFKLIDSLYPAIACSWTKPYGSSGENAYNFAVPAKIEEEAVMFIGMNPSYIPSKKQQSEEESKESKETTDNSYLKYWQDPNEPDKESGWQFEKFYEPKSKFYKSSYFKDLAKFTEQLNKNTKYAHLDLLAIRHTTQGDIENALKKYYNSSVASRKNLIKKENKNSPFVDFINAQIDIFKELLQAAKPKVIIVNSGLASNILRNNEVFFQDDTSKYNTDIWKDLRSHLGMRLYWDKSIFAYRWSKTPFNAEGVLEKKDDDIPVFLCGMTSGQRALDSGRREELIAQVANAITQNDHSKNNFLQTH